MKRHVIFYAFAVMLVLQAAAGTYLVVLDTDGVENAGLVILGVTLMISGALILVRYSDWYIKLGVSAKARTYGNPKINEVLMHALEAYELRPTIGLCETVSYLLLDEKYSTEDFQLFTNYFKENCPKDTFLPNKKGRYTKEPYEESLGYNWHPDDHKGRINWLKEHIKLTE